MTSKFREIEIKHPLKSSKENLIKRINELGAEQTNKLQIQEDTYYVPKHRNFLDEEIVSEWLRIRKTEKKTNVNFKRWLPIGQENQTHCDEYETSISNVEAMEKIFFALDIKEIVKVRKERSTWLLNGVEIALDSVDNLGDFIELEAKVLNDDVEAAHKLLQDVLKLLDVEVLPRDRRGYPYQLLNRDK